MSEGQETRAERIAHYKEERRRQLASQFGTHNDLLKKTKDPTFNNNSSSSNSSSDGPRSTRTSRLRANVTESRSSPTNNTTINSKEKSRTSPSGSHELNSCIERDKSSKRKSNLNRALNCEEVASNDDDVKSRRRRRRFFPQEILDQSLSATNINDDKTKNDISITATTSLQSSTSQSSLANTKRSYDKKTELSIHMENARKGITPSYSEIGKYKTPSAKRGIITKIANPKEAPLKPSTSNVDNSNKEIPRRSIKISNSKTSNNLDNNCVKTNRNIAKKMENLTALTKETLARVERLTCKTKESLKTTCIGGNLGKSSDSVSRNNKNQQPSSILKKKSIDEPSIETVPNHLPVSILKRKVSQDDHNQSSVSSSTHTPPVTFSPSVVEPTTTNRRQGILKKRRSLDESQVMRHRSCSPDVVNKALDSRSILKNQRRSSLEELRRIQSPETPLHGILKRKTLRNDDEDQSLNSPQSILKRRSGASSAGSTNNTPHVSITTAVILAAAGGAEMILESSEPVKPILKKKSFSEEHSYNDNTHTDIPKPILKKKSSTDTDDGEDKPKKPILKITKNSTDKDNLDISDNDGDFKPVLKQGRDEFPRPRLSFCNNSNNNNNSDDDIVIKPHTRRSNTICTGYNIKSCEMVHEDDSELKKPRTLSVSELVMNFEHSVSTGAIPKRSNLKRRNDRCKTQPVTSNELEASLNLVESPRLIKPPTLNDTTVDILNYTTSLDNDSKLNSFFLSSFHITSPDSGVKMSSDSAFQSLGDGLELDQDDDNHNSSNNTSTESCLKTPKLEQQMRAIADEAKKMKRDKDKLTQLQSYRNRRSNPNDSQRFSTQPVTFNEVQEASRLKEISDNAEEQDEIEPSELSLLERIRLFNDKVDKKIPQKRDVPRNRLNRFSTQPVTSNEVETARSLPVKTHALDEKLSTERKGILKSNQSTVNRLSGGTSPLLPPKSVLKKRDSLTRLNQSTDISDITYDEGISCNDSGSDSENASVSFNKNIIDIERYSHSVSPSKYQSNSETSDGGESSGSREVRKIFRSENKLRVKQALETALSKSKSQGIVGDEKRDSNIRKTTTTLRRSQTQTGMPRTIAELQAKLQESGESSWKKRIQHNSNDDLKFLKDKNKYNDELSEKSILALKKDELDAAAQQWKTRVEKSDAKNFSVAGRMEKSKDGKIDDLPINIPLVDNNKRTPQAKRYKGKEDSDLSSTPVSPNKSNIHELTRSFSVPERNQESTGNDNALITGRKVSIIKPDDYTFTSFFKSIEETKTTERLDITLDDFDLVPRQSLLVQKKNVQIQKRRGASKNPVKALASRTDIVNEYTEIITGVAEREKKRLNIEKLAKSSNLAVEALAGLASKEDFTNVALKKTTSISAPVPFKSVMLLHVKGRRHVQTRLVEPSVSSINEGDNFILVTSNALYNYIGAYANVIEQSRAADIINYIQQTGDLGCKVNEVITINAKNSSTKTRQINEFWKILGCNESQTFTDGGNPNEDEIYESNILATNMIYKLENNELVPFDEYWGTIPKIEMLQPTKVLVFDFGTEMYVWSGKNAPFDEKRRALKLAKELWDEGYNYSDCNICPINVASILGDQPIARNLIKIGKRPEWALFAKITQYRETILFKEKFLDWPDFSRVIRIKRDHDDKFVNPSYDIRPCDVELMLNNNEPEPDLIVEGYHLGRGNKYFDEETKRLFEFDTLNLTMWRILENTFEKLCDKSVAHFYDGDSYIIRWCYRMTVKGRELSGKPSKYAQTGRDRCIYFCWQGSKSSINEKGSAALLTVELDNENAPQIRVVQGLEPAAFLGVFNGSMVVHIGKRDVLENSGKSRLFMVKGELEREVSIIEVPCNCEQLRSRTSFVLINSEDGEIYIWHGAKSSKQTRKVCKIVVDRIADEKPNELYLNNFDDIDIIEVKEGDENNKFYHFIENNSRNYYSLLDSNLDYDYTMRLFYLSSLSGTFKATEILCPYRSHFSSPYPFLQSDLYSASQPALFLIDNHHELWLWQGWWPETEENIELSEQTGSGAVRWQAERKAAMQTAIEYWKRHHSDGGGESTPIPAYLVWAGFEPLEFKNLFPTWIDKEKVIELNSKEAKRKDCKVRIENELAMLSRSTYPLTELLQRPLPEGVDPTQLEIYLTAEDFQEALAMTREEFQKLPLWKQTAIKKEKGLF